MERLVRLVGQLKPIMKDKACSEFPGAFQLNQLLLGSTEFQICIVPQSDSKFCVIKHYTVLKNKLKRGTIVSLCKGNARVVQWGSRSIKTMKKA